MKLSNFSTFSCILFLIQCKYVGCIMQQQYLTTWRSPTKIRIQSTIISQVCRWFYFLYRRNRFSCFISWYSEWPSTDTRHCQIAIGRLLRWPSNFTYSVCPGASICG